MKKIITILFVIHCSLLIATAQWIKQFSPNHDLNDIEFINRYTGWACGDNYIYKTTDGGITWIEQSHPLAYLIQQIYPVNENIVYAAGIWNFMKTTNGGVNWSAFFAGGSGQGLPELEGLYFINENTGWLVGNVVAMKTTNGGISFVDSMRIEEISQDVYFKDSLNGILCGYSGGFRKTTDGGKTWNRIQIILSGPLYDFIRISVINDSLVWLASKSVYRSADFGNTWDSLGFIPMTEPNRSIYCMDFSNPTTGYAGGASLELFKTTNGGYNWIPQQTTQFHPGLYLGMYTFNDSIVWASGRRIILNTATGGQTGINNSSVTLLNDFKLYQNFPNPFNPITNINYELRITNYILLKVYDVIGNDIITLVNGIQRAGNYTIKFNGNNFPSGIYFYSLYTENQLIDTKKMFLIK